MFMIGAVMCRHMGLRSQSENPTRCARVACGQCERKTKATRPAIARRGRIKPYMPVRGVRPDGERLSTEYNLITRPTPRRAPAGVR